MPHYADFCPLTRFVHPSAAPDGSFQQFLQLQNSSERSHAEVAHGEQQQREGEDEERLAPVSHSGLKPAPRTAKRPGGLRKAGSYVFLSDLKGRKSGRGNSVIVWEARPRRVYSASGGFGPGTDVA